MGPAGGYRFAAERTPGIASPGRVELSCPRFHRVTAPLPSRVPALTASVQRTGEEDVKEVASVRGKSGKEAAVFHLAPSFRNGPGPAGWTSGKCTTTGGSPAVDSLPPPCVCWGPCRALGASLGLRGNNAPPPHPVIRSGLYRRPHDGQRGRKGHNMKSPSGKPDLTESVSLVT